MRAYRRTESGALEIVTLYREGDEIVNSYGDRLVDTGETQLMLGWPDEGRAKVYKPYHPETGEVSGPEYLIPA